MTKGILTIKAAPSCIQTSAILLEQHYTEMHITRRGSNAQIETALLTPLADKSIIWWRHVDSHCKFLKSNVRNNTSDSYYSHMQNTHTISVSTTNATMISRVNEGFHWMDYYTAKCIFRIRFCKLPSSICSMCRWHLGLTVVTARMRN